MYSSVKDAISLTVWDSAGLPMVGGFASTSPSIYPIAVNETSVLIMLIYRYELSSLDTHTIECTFGDCVSWPASLGIRVVNHDDAEAQALRKWILREFILPGINVLIVLILLLLGYKTYRLLRQRTAG